MNEVLKPGFDDVAKKRVKRVDPLELQHKQRLAGAEEHLRMLERKSAEAQEEPLDDLRGEEAALKNMLEDAGEQAEPALRSEARHVTDEANYTEYSRWQAGVRVQNQRETIANMEKELKAIRDYKQQAIDEIDRLERLNNNAHDAAIAWNTVAAKAAHNDMRDIADRIRQESRFAAQTDDEINKALTEGVILTLQESGRRARKEWQDRYDTLEELKDAEVGSAPLNTQSPVPQETGSRNRQADEADPDATQPYPRVQGNEDPDATQPYPHV